MNELDDRGESSASWFYAMDDAFNRAQAAAPEVSVFEVVPVDHAAPVVLSHLETTTHALDNDAMRSIAAVEGWKLCEWCDSPMPGKRSHARTCSQSCRQALHRFRVAPAGANASTPLRFAYADPAYPGLAEKYYEQKEVDHAKLCRSLVEEYDAFALSTSAAALPMVLDDLRVALDTTPRLLRKSNIALSSRDIRVCPWVHGSRASTSYRARNAWEPLIVVGGRPVKHAVDDELDDVLLWGGRQHSHPGALVGMKSAAFCEWMFRLLGAQRGDELADLFPGSGAVTRAWSMFQREATSSELPSRLAGATLSLRERTKPSRSDDDSHHQYELAIDDRDGQFVATSGAEVSM